MEGGAGGGKKLGKHVVEIEMSRGTTVHSNPLKYRRSFVKRQETENPMLVVSADAKQSARKSAMGERTSQRVSRIRKVLETQRSRAEELREKETSDEGIFEAGMFVDNPMIK